MTIAGISQTASDASSTTKSAADNNTLGKDAFLTLMVAQLQNQDPLNPADGTEFTAQLAQFSSLEQLQNIGSTLEDFEVYQSVSNNIQAAGFIGKTITATGDTFGVNEGVADTIRYDLEGDADSVYIQIYDSAGNFITDIDAGFQAAGEQQVTWDGEDEYGTAVDDGVYTFSVMATGADGETVGSTSYTTGIVSGIDYESGETSLLVNGREVSISSVIRIVETSSEEEI